MDVERNANYASRGLGGTALGFGIGGATLALMNSGVLPGLFNGQNGGCHEKPMTHYEAAQAAKIAELETEVKLRDANAFTMGEMNNLRNYVDGRFEKIECVQNQQAVYNATNTAALSCIQGQVAQIMGLTKLVVPNSSVCPGWGTATVTVTPATTTTTG